MLRVIGAMGVALVLCQPDHLSAQSRPQAAPAPPSAPAPEPPPPAYEPELLRLAETIGAVAFLRQLCGASDAEQWRARMAEMLEAEGVTQGRRDRLAGAYNRGFRGYALTYRSCTSAAQEAAARLTRDGSRLSRALASRFGG
jgi:uncharacterized protein (TIGR02301 family)